jgi:hypothetical protein
MRRRPVDAEQPAPALVGRGFECVRYARHLAAPPDLEPAGAVAHDEVHPFARRAVDHVDLGPRTALQGGQHAAHPVDGVVHAFDQHAVLAVHHERADDCRIAQSARLGVLEHEPSFLDIHDGRRWASETPQADIVAGQVQDRSALRRGGHHEPGSDFVMVRAAASPRQEQRLQVRQEVEAAGRGPHAVQVPFHEPLPLGLRQRRLDRGQRQAGAIHEVLRWETVLESQRVEHELERQVGAPHFVVLRQRRAGQRLVHVEARLAIAHLPHHAMREAQLAMRAGADAEVVAELPVVEVVPAAVVGPGEGRDLVARQPRGFGHFG